MTAAVDRPLRVGLVSYDFDPPIGGQGVEAKALAGHIRDVHPEVDLTVIAASAPEAPSNVRLPTPQRNGAEVLFSLRLAARLDRIVATRRLDCLLVYGGPGGVVLLRQPRVPYVYVANHTYASQARLQGDRLAYRVLQRLERRGYQHAAHVACISESTRQELVDAYGVPPGRTATIPPTMDLERFFAISSSGDPATILFVGRLHPRKNVEVLLQAVRRLRASGTAASLRIVGDGAHRPVLERLCAELDVQDAVRFLGRRSDEEVLSEIASCGVLVLPSFFEGFGIVVAEAMAAGRVAVGANVPGIRDALPVPDLLFPPADDEALARILRHLVEDGGSRRFYAAQLRAFADAHYRLETTTGQMLRLLRPAAQRGTGR